MFNSIEMCTGVAGQALGQALGQEVAGFEHFALIELEPAACATLGLNRRSWRVIQGNLCSFCATPYKGIDLLAGGMPCPPFSKAR